MINPPKTLEEAKATRYGAWAGDPNGRRYSAGRCAYEVANGWHFVQCFRKGRYGRANLYCKQHAAIIARRETKE